MNSDGTWINVPKQSIYTLRQFSEYCASQNEPLDEEITKSLMSQGRVGQVFDVLIPSKESLGGMSGMRKYMPKDYDFSAQGETKRFTERFIKDLTDFAPDVEIPEDATFVELAKLTWGQGIVPRTRNKVERETGKMSEEQKKEYDENQELMKELLAELQEGDGDQPDWLASLIGEDNADKFSIEEEIWDEFIEMNPGAEEFFYSHLTPRDYSREDLDIAMYLMNTAESYGSGGIPNKLTEKYFEAIKAGKNLKQDAVQYRALDRYMFVMGKFYMPPGTSPQDGEHEDVYNLLELSMKVLSPYVEERRRDMEAWTEED